MFKIDTNIPIPKRGGRKYLKYPFSELGLGHSFFVPLVEGDPIKVARNRMWSAVLYRASRNGEKYVISLVDENGTKGFRVWLISRQEPQTKKEANP